MQQLQLHGGGEHITPETCWQVIICLLASMLQQVLGKDRLQWHSGSCCCRCARDAAADADLAATKPAVEVQTSATVEAVCTIGLPQGVRTLTLAAL